MLEKAYINGLVQDYSNSIANALELLQSCAKPSMYFYVNPNNLALAIHPLSAKPRPRERGDTSSSTASTTSQLDQLDLSTTDNSHTDTAPLPSPSSSPRRGEAANALLPPWATATSSESEYSDTEGGQASKLRSYLARVRQCALNCFHALIKVMAFQLFTVNQGWDFPVQNLFFPSKTG